ncbi:IS110 family transposase [Kitasatospora sp. NPDC001660]
MPQSILPAQQACDIEEVILGVDTHKDVHVAAVITALGAPLAHQEFPTTAAGYRQLLAWASSFGILRRAGVECTGSYGTALMRVLRREGVEVIEINQPDRATRRKRGKTDAVDADAAARAVLSGRAAARLTDEAAFAALCGVSPVEQSSGKTQRRRLNRGGNRQANAALYRIVQSRLRWDQRTQAYLQRRTAEGMSRREIIRCLKRYVARELYRHLQPPAPSTAA